MNNLFEFRFLNRLLSFWCLLCFQAIVLNALKSKNSARIVGGDEVPQGSGRWPFMVALLALNRESRSYEVFCGATVLNIDSIMTAAHCLVKIKPGDIIGFVGHENILHLGNERNQLDLASKFIVHPQFMHRYNKNDIAIIKLKWALDFTKIGNVEPVCLPQSQDDSLVDTENCYAIGWGLNATKGQLKDILQQVKLSIWDDETCTRHQWDYRPYTASVMLCAGLMEGGKGPCFGDSGGPLVCPLKSDRSVYVQHGIISFQDTTDGCVRMFNPGYYTRVTHYLDWIKKISKKGHDEL